MNMKNDSINLLSLSRFVEFGVMEKSHGDRVGVFLINIALLIILGVFRNIDHFVGGNFGEHEFIEKEDKTLLG